VVIVVFELLTSALRQFLLIYAVQRMDVSMDVQFLSHILRLPARYFENMRVGDIIARFGETKTVRNLLTGTLMSVLLDVVTIFVYLGMMLAYNVSLTLV